MSLDGNVDITMKGSKSLEEIRIHRGKSFIHYYAPENLQTVDYNRVKERLDTVLIQPINLIANIVKEELQEQCWDTEVDTIKFQALRDLALLIIERKRRGENSNEFNKMKKEIIEISNLFNSLQEEKGKSDAEFRMTFDFIVNECEDSPNEEVQGLAETLKHSSQEDRPYVIQHIISALNQNIKSQIDSKVVDNDNLQLQESRVLRLENENQELLSDLENERVRHAELLRSTKASYERQLQIQMLKMKQMQNSSSLQNELEAMKNELLGQLQDQAKANNEASLSAEAEYLHQLKESQEGDQLLNDKLDIMLLKIDESQKKEKLLEECLLNLHESLNVYDGEEFDSNTDFTEKTKSVQRRLLKIEKNIGITSDDIDKLKCDVSKLGSEISDPNERSKFYEEKLQEMAVIDAKFSKDKERSDKQILQMQDHILSLQDELRKTHRKSLSSSESMQSQLLLLNNINDSNNEVSKQLEQNFSNIESKLGISHEENDISNDDLISRSILIQSAIAKLATGDLKNQIKHQTSFSNLPEIIQKSETFKDPSELRKFYKIEFDKIDKLKEEAEKELINLQIKFEKQNDHITTLENTIREQQKEKINIIEKDKGNITKLQTQNSNLETTVSLLSDSIKNIDLTLRQIDGTTIDNIESTKVDDNDFVAKAIEIQKRIQSLNMQTIEYVEEGKDAEKILQEGNEITDSDKRCCFYEKSLKEISDEKTKLSQELGNTKSRLAACEKNNQIIIRENNKLKENNIHHLHKVDNTISNLEEQLRTSDTITTKYAQYLIAISNTLSSIDGISETNEDMQVLTTNIQKRLMNVQLIENQNPNDVYKIAKEVIVRGDSILDKDQKINYFRDKIMCLTNDAANISQQNIILKNELASLHNQQDMLDAEAKRNICEIDSIQKELKNISIVHDLEIDHASCTNALITLRKVFELFCLKYQVNIEGAISRGITLIENEEEEKKETIRDLIRLGLRKPRQSIDAENVDDLFEGTNTSERPSCHPTTENLEILAYLKNIEDILTLEEEEEAEFSNIETRFDFIKNKVSELFNKKQEYENELKFIEASDDDNDDKIDSIDFNEDEDTQTDDKSSKSKQSNKQLRRKLKKLKKTNYELINGLNKIEQATFNNEICPETSNEPLEDRIELIIHIISHIYDELISNESRDKFTTFLKDNLSIFEPTSRSIPSHLSNSDTSTAYTQILSSHNHSQSNQHQNDQLSINPLISDTSSVPEDFDNENHNLSDELSTKHERKSIKDLLKQMKRPLPSTAGSKTSISDSAPNSIDFINSNLQELANTVYGNNVPEGLTEEPLDVQLNKINSRIQEMNNSMKEASSLLSQEGSDESKKGDIGSNVEQLVERIKSLESDKQRANDTLEILERSIYGETLPEGLTEEPLDAQLSQIHSRIQSILHSSIYKLKHTDDDPQQHKQLLDQQKSQLGQAIRNIELSTISSIPSSDSMGQSKNNHSEIHTIHSLIQNGNESDLDHEIDDLFDGVNVSPHVPTLKATKSDSPNILLCLRSIENVLPIEDEVDEKDLPSIGSHIDFIKSQILDLFNKKTEYEDELSLIKSLKQKEEKENLLKTKKFIERIQSLEADNKRISENLQSIQQSVYGDNIPSELNDVPLDEQLKEINDRIQYILKSYEITQKNINELQKKDRELLAREKSQLSEAIRRIGLNDTNNKTEIDQVDEKHINELIKLGLNKEKEDNEVEEINDLFEGATLSTIKIKRESDSEGLEDIIFERGIGEFEIEEEDKNEGAIDQTKEKLFNENKSNSNNYKNRIESENDNLVEELLDVQLNKINSRIQEMNNSMKEASSLLSQEGSDESKKGDIGSNVEQLVERIKSLESDKQQLKDNLQELANTVYGNNVPEGLTEEPLDVQLNKINSRIQEMNNSMKEASSLLSQEGSDESKKGDIGSNVEQLVERIKSLESDKQQLKDNLQELANTVYGNNVPEGLTEEPLDVQLNKINSRIQEMNNSMKEASSLLSQEGSDESKKGDIGSNVEQLVERIKSLESDKQQLKDNLQELANTVYGNNVPEGLTEEPLDVQLNKINSRIQEMNNSMKEASSLLSQEGSDESKKGDIGSNVEQLVERIKSLESDKQRANDTLEILERSIYGETLPEGLTEEPLDVQLNKINSRIQEMNNSMKEASSLLSQEGSDESKKGDIGSNVEQLVERIKSLESDKQRANDTLEILERSIYGETLPEGLTEEPLDVQLNKINSRIQEMNNSMKEASSLLSQEGSDESKKGDIGSNVEQLVERIKSLESDKQQLKDNLQELANTVYGNNVPEGLTEEPLDVQLNKINSRIQEMNNSMKEASSLLSQEGSDESKKGDIGSNVEQLVERIKSLESDKQQLKDNLQELANTVYGNNVPEGLTEEPLDVQLNKINSRIQEMNNSMKEASSLLSQEGSDESKKGDIGSNVEQLVERIKSLESDKQRANDTLEILERSIYGETLPEGLTEEPLDVQLNKINSRIQEMNNSMKEASSLLSQEGSDESKKGDIGSNVEQLVERIKSLESDKQQLKDNLQELANTVYGNNVPEGLTEEPLDVQLNKINSRIQEMNNSMKEASSLLSQEGSDESKKGDIGSNVEQLVERIKSLESDKQQLKDNLQELANTVYGNNVPEGLTEEPLDVQLNKINSRIQEMNNSMKEASSLLSQEGSDESKKGDIGSNVEQLVERIKSLESDKQRANDTLEILERSIYGETLPEGLTEEPLDVQLNKINSRIQEMNNSMKEASSLLSQEGSDESKKGDIGSNVEQLVERIKSLESDKQRANDTLEILERSIYGETLPEGLTEEPLDVQLNKINSRIQEMNNSMKEASSLLSQEGSDESKKGDIGSNVEQLVERIKSLESDKQQLKDNLQELANTVYGNNVPEGLTEEPLDVQLNKINSRIQEMNNSMKEASSLLSQEGSDESKKGDIGSNVEQLVERIKSLESDKQRANDTLEILERSIYGETLPEGLTEEPLDVQLNKINSRIQEMNNSMKEASSLLSQEGSDESKKGDIGSNVEQLVERIKSLESDKQQLKDNLQELANTVYGNNVPEGLTEEPLDVQLNKINSRIQEMNNSMKEASSLLSQEGSDESKKGDIGSNVEQLVERIKSLESDKQQLKDNLQELANTVYGNNVPEGLTEEPLDVQLNKINSRIQEMNNSMKEASSLLSQEGSDESKKGDIGSNVEQLVERIKSLESDKQQLKDNLQELANTVYGNNVPEGLTEEPLDVQLNKINSRIQEMNNSMKEASSLLSQEGSDESKKGDIGSNVEQLVERIKSLESDKQQLKDNLQELANTVYGNNVPEGLTEEPLDVQLNKINSRIQEMNNSMKEASSLLSQEGSDESKKGDIGSNVEQLVERIKSLESDKQQLKDNLQELANTVYGNNVPEGLTEEPLDVQLNKINSRIQEMNNSMKEASSLLSQEGSDESKKGDIGSNVEQLVERIKSLESDKQQLKDNLQELANTVYGNNVPEGLTEEPLDVQLNKINSRIQEMNNSMKEASSLLSQEGSDESKKGDIGSNVEQLVERIKSLESDKQQLKDNLQELANTVYGNNVPEGLTEEPLDVQLNKINSRIQEMNNSMKEASSLLSQEGSDESKKGDIGSNVEQLVERIKSLESDKQQLKDNLQELANTVYGNNVPEGLTEEPLDVQLNKINSRIQEMNNSMKEASSLLSQEGSDESKKGDIGSNVEQLVERIKSLESDKQQLKDNLQELANTVYGNNVPEGLTEEPLDVQLNKINSRIQEMNNSMKEASSLLSQEGSDESKKGDIGSNVEQLVERIKSLESDKQQLKDNLQELANTVYGNNVPEGLTEEPLDVQLNKINSRIQEMNNSMKEASSLLSQEGSDESKKGDIGSNVEQLVERIKSLESDKQRANDTLEILERSIYGETLPEGLTEEPLDVQLNKINSRIQEMNNSMKEASSLLSQEGSDESKKGDIGSNVEQLVERIKSLESDKQQLKDNLQELANTVYGNNVPEGLTEEPLDVQLNKINSRIQEMNNSMKEASSLLSQEGSDESKKGDIGSNVEQLVERIKSLESDKQQLKDNLQELANTVYGNNVPEGLTEEPLDVQLNKINSRIQEMNNSMKEASSLLSQEGSDESKKGDIGSNVEQLVERIKSLESDKQQLKDNLQELANTVYGNNVPEGLTEEPLDVQLNKINSRIQEMNNSMKEASSLLSQEGSDESKKGDIGSNVEQLVERIKSLESDKQQLKDNLQELANTVYGNNVPEGLTEEPLDVQLNKINSRIQEMNNSMKEASSLLSQEGSDESKKGDIGSNVEQLVERIKSLESDKQRANDTLEILERSIYGETLPEGLTEEPLDVQLNKINSRIQEMNNSMKEASSLLSQEGSDESKKGDIGSNVEQLVERIKSLESDKQQLKDNLQELANTVYGNNVPEGLTEEPLDVQLNKINSRIQEMNNSMKEASSLLSQEGSDESKKGDIGSNVEQLVERIKSLESDKQRANDTLEILERSIYGETLPEGLSENIRMSKLVKEISSLKENQSLNDQQISSLLTNLKTVENIIFDDSSLREAEEPNLEARLSSIQTNIQNLSNEKRQLENAVNDLQDQLIDSELFSPEHRALTSSKPESLSNSEIAPSKQRISNIIQEMKKQIAQLKNKKYLLEAGINRVENLLYEEKADLQKKREIEDRYSDIVKEISLMKEALQKKENETLSLTKENTTYSDGLKTIESIISGETSAQESEKEPLETRISTIKQQIQTISNDKKELENAVNDLQEQLIDPELLSAESSQSQLSQTLSDNKFNQQRVSNIIQEMKKQIAHLKHKKYLLEAGIKRVENVLYEGDSESHEHLEIEVRESNIVDEVTKLLKYKAVMIKIRSFLMKGKPSDDDDIELVAKMVSDLKHANESKGNDQEKSHLELTAKVVKLEKDKTDYNAALTQIEQILFPPPPESTSSPRRHKLPVRLSKISDKLNALITQTSAISTVLDSGNQEINEEILKQIPDILIDYKKSSSILQSIESLVAISQNTDPNIHQLLIATRLDQLKGKVEALCKGMKEQKATQNKLIAAAKKIKTLNETNESYEAAIRALAEELAKQIGTSDERQALTDVKSSIISISESINTLNDKINDLNLEKVKLLTEINKLRKDQNNYSEVSNQLKDQLGDIEKLLVNFEGETIEDKMKVIIEMKTLLDSLQIKDASSVTKIKNQLAKLKDLARAAKEMNLRFNKLQTEHQQLVHENETNKAKAAAAVQMILHRLSSLFQHTEEEPTFEFSNFDDLNSETSSFTKIVDFIKRQLETYNESIAKLSKQQKDHAGKLKLLDNQKKAAESQLEEKNAIEEELETSKKKIQEMEKQILSISSNGDESLKTLNNELSKLQKEKREMEENLIKQKKQMTLLMKRFNTSKADLDSIKKYLASIIPQNREEIQGADSAKQAIDIFLSRYPIMLANLLSDKFENIFLKLDHRIHSLNSKLTPVVQKYSKFVESFASSRQKMLQKDLTLTHIRESYDDTLSALFPPSTNLKSMSKASDIHHHVEKLRAIVSSIFKLIPRSKIPPKGKQQVYNLALQLRRILSSSTPEISTDLSTDISMSEINISDTQMQHSMFFEYESRIKELVDKLYHSMPFSDLSDILGDILGVEPQETNEEAIVEMFNAVRDRLDEAEVVREEATKFKKTANALLQGIGNKVPPNLQHLVDELKDSKL